MVVEPDRFRNTYRMTFFEHVNYKKTNLSPQIFEYLSRVILYNLRAEKNKRVQHDLFSSVKNNWWLYLFTAR